MKVELFSGKTIAWFQHEAIHFYYQFKNKKFKYSIVSLLFLLVCGGSFIQGSRNGYLRGYFLSQKLSSIISANTDIGALKVLAKQEYDNVKRSLELDLDSQIQSMFWTDYPVYPPWYLLYDTKRTNEEEIELWENAMSRIALYRKAHPSKNKWVKQSIEELMTYLPSDSIEVVNLDSISTRAEGKQ
ncbi:MAG: hypothetical protein HOD11_16600 [Candidatus Marinimicrobia bacterium]|jgi:hypothetical protein|nr:hypothetical protein [Candidatus Neomarinimicrobiota bacterium]MBT4682411.1 hypothetical protein [Chloroflexota bacterium]MBT4362582.1 hypothetical protein [Candidatus Neomarinimicrobiota bacterium]MBT5269666.1 hypothetical protein [Candidatus Neomarinimicrobiota bacterium]MBT6011396.1 hypothetical protein [Candidatus Neomarinimicrobiota bacterium]